MLNTERPQAEALIAALLAGFDRKASPERLEAYWRGCNRMPLTLLERVIDRALGDQGPDEIPTPKQLWNIARHLRTDGTPKPSTRSTVHDPLKVLGNTCLSHVLLRNRGVNDDAASDESLRQMIAAKNRILEQARGSYGDRPLTAEENAELSDVLIAALKKLWRPRPEEETAADFEHFARTGHVRDATQLL